MVVLGGVVLEGTENECRGLKVGYRKETKVRNVSSGL